MISVCNFASRQTPRSFRDVGGSRTLSRSFFTRHNSSTSTTYYDSQSGMHVPIHNENEVYVYKHWVNPYLQLYKNTDVAFEAKDDLLELSRNFNGVAIDSNLSHRRDERNLETIMNILPTLEEFRVFVPPLPTHDSQDMPKNAIVMLKHTDDSLVHRLTEYKQRNIKTSLILTCNNDTVSSEPFEVANDIANVMDESGAGDYVLVTSHHNHNDYVLQLCEELSYLDVPGPTMKSRLVLDCDLQTTDAAELIDDVMSIGVNKFVARNDELHDCIRTVASEQGKELVKTS